MSKKDGEQDTANRKAVGDAAVSDGVRAQTQGSRASTQSDEPEPPRVRAAEARAATAVEGESQTAPTKSAAPPMPEERSEMVETLPSPEAISEGNPDDPAPAPGIAPRGDARSLRRASNFALVYRRSSAVITRFGAVGKRGQWRIVQYPTQSAAGNGYAKECARWLDEGYTDFQG